MNTKPLDDGRLYKELFSVPSETWLKYYDQPHRFYHTRDHIQHVLTLMLQAEGSELEDEYIIAALFHDIIYDPRRTDNEEKSARFFLEHATHHVCNNAIADIIRKTKDHKEENPLNSADMFDITGSTYHANIVRTEKAIFKEFQFFSISDFVKGRSEFLHTAPISYRNLAEKLYNYNVAIYAGSFNPITIGHQSVIEQAEKIFDKVIIAVGINPEKSNGAVVSLVATEKDMIVSQVSQAFPFHEVISYKGFLTDEIRRLETEHGKYANFTLIRGLRNGYDLSYEMNQLEFMKQMYGEIKVAFIPCETKYAHISSSAIRSLMKFNRDEASKYLVSKYDYARSL